MYQWRKGNTSRSGFTLVELLVVFSIWAVITGIAVTEYVTFRHTADFETAVQDVALSLREMQVYGIGSREANAGGGDFSSAYGMHFQIDNTGGGTGSDGVDDPAGEIILFIDSSNPNPPNGVFENGVDTVIKKISYPGRFSITKLCVEPVSGPIDCWATEGAKRIDVTFRRPRADALVASSGASVQYAKASIEFTSTSGEVKTMYIYPTGQISVE